MILDENIIYVMYLHSLYVHLAFPSQNSIMLLRLQTHNIPANKRPWPDQLLELPTAPMRGGLSSSLVLFGMSFPPCNLRLMSDAPNCCI